MARTDYAAERSGTGSHEAAQIFHGCRDFVAVPCEPGPASARRRRAWRFNKHRHCERSEAIQNLSAVAVWIASLRSQ
ncbi:hypothetical protein FXB38_16105 [Bradyrhizobium cytisi]|uniref:Uncharacterized protein n=1 Tax=Bradyrhizobium cytisi TaxID=515489 RepID=A0A5S4WPI0_9BRAD|nr:hypothetical protein FXB38_16105 [Bradyrhizobium cytisi]